MTLHYLWTQKQSKWDDFWAQKSSENDDFWAQKTSLWLWLISGPRNHQNGTISGPRNRQYDQENLYVVVYKDGEMMMQNKVVMDEGFDQEQIFDQTRTGGE